MVEKTNINLENRVSVGQKVVVYPGFGEDPIEGVVNKVDEVTGIILEVVVKDKNKLTKILNVKKMVVYLAPTLFDLLKRLWKKLWK